MARYDDGGIEFGQEQFAKAREYNEEQAKKQEKFSKKLQLANIAVTGVTSLINQKADALELNNVVERAHYLNTLESAKTWTDRYNKYVSQGLTEEQMYKTDLREDAFGYLQQKYEGYDDVRTIFGDAVEEAVTNVKDMPNARTFEQWKKTNNLMLKIPSMSREELVGVIQKDGAAPRNISAFLGNSVKNYFRAHDEDTLKDKDTKASEKMLSGALGDRFGAATGALREWKSKGNAIAPLQEFLNTANGKELIGRLSKDEKVTIDKQTLVNKKIGVSTTTPVMIVAGRTPDKGFGVIDNKTQLMTDLTTTVIEDVPVTPQEIQETQGISQLYLDSDRISDNALQAYNDLDLETQDQLDGFNTHLIATTRNILKENPDLSNNKAIEIATEYYLAQGQTLTHLKPSLFDIARIDTTITVDTDDRTQMLSFINSIKRTQPDYAIPGELANTRDSLINLIISGTGSQYEKDQDIESLNILFQKEGNLEPYVLTEPEQVKAIDKTLTEFEASNIKGGIYLDKWNEREELKKQSIALKPKNLFARWTMSIEEKEESWKEYNAFIKLHNLDISDDEWAKSILKTINN